MDLKAKIKAELEKQFEEMENRLKAEEERREKNRQIYGDFVSDVLNLCEMEQKSNER